MARGRLFVSAETLHPPVSDHGDRTYRIFCSHIGRLDGCAFVYRRSLGEKPEKQSYSPLSGPRVGNLEPVHRTGRRPAVRRDGSVDATFRAFLATGSAGGHRDVAVLVVPLPRTLAGLSAADIFFSFCHRRGAYLRRTIGVAGTREVRSRHSGRRVYHTGFFQGPV